LRSLWNIEGKKEEEKKEEDVMLSGEGEKSLQISFIFEA
jgi:hypothetical protein